MKFAYMPPLFAMDGMAVAAIEILNPAGDRL
jgi:hypothetical protein